MGNQIGDDSPNWLKTPVLIKASGKKITQQVYITDPVALQRAAACQAIYSQQYPKANMPL